MKTRFWLLVILALAAILRFALLGSGDPVNDEALLAFRAVGLMDFDNAEYQTTPWQWTDPDIPWWARLSFHDHPPLVFWIQNIFMKIFGENVWAFRLPSTLFGIASVWLVFLIGKKLYGERAGLLASIAGAVTLNSVYISRVGLQESYVIFFLLLTSYLLLLISQKSRAFLWLGISLGLGLLAKYTAIAAVLIALSYMLYSERTAFRKREFWLGAVLMIAVLSPVLIYNAMLYKNFGHFDFQLSYVFGQNPEAWQIQPGKEIGSLADRLQNIIPRLITSNSWLFLIAAFGAFIGFLIKLSRSGKDAVRENLFLLIAIFWLFALILVIGPSYRFISMLTPFFALAVGRALDVGLEKIPRLTPKAAYGILGFFLVFETYYSANNQIRPYPLGSAPWIASYIKRETWNWGYGELDDFLEKELAGRFPAAVFETKYKFVGKNQEEAIAKAKRNALEPYVALLIYDRDIFNFSQLWIFDRRQIYHGWPALQTEDYLKILEENGSDYFAKNGFTHYFVIPTEAVDLRRITPLATSAPKLEEELVKKSITPISIKNKRGEESFRVYKF